MKMMNGGAWSMALNPERSNSGSDPKLLHRIGRELRSVYGEVVDEPVPAHLANILRRLDKRSTHEDR